MKRQIQIKPKVTTTLQPPDKNTTEIKKKPDKSIALKKPMPSDKDINQNNNESTRRTSLTTIQIVIKKSNEQEEKLQ